MKHLTTVIQIGIYGCAILFMCLINDTLGTHRIAQAAVPEPTQEVRIELPAVIKTKEPATDYRTYIPLYQNQQESNLYDRISKNQVLYLRRKDCPDCQKQESTIIRQLAACGYPYLILDVSKEPEQEPSGLVVPSSVVKAIGIEQVPAVAFIKDGKWITRIENQFSKSGDEIQMTCWRVFND